MKKNVKRTMLVTNGYKVKTVVMTVWVYIFVPGLHLVKGKQCSNGANNLPVLRFCSSDTFRSKSTVIIDGHYADTLNDDQNCTCIARALFNSTTKLIFEDIPSSSSFNNKNNCGSKVVFKQQNYEERLKICGGDGALPINDTINDITVNITLVKEAYPTDTSYKFCIVFDQGNTMDITCEKADEGVITTHERHETEQASHRIDNSNTTYIAIGCGTLGLLIVVFVGIFIFRKLRRNKGQAGKNNDQCDDNDDYGLQYNTLYISADDEAIPQLGAYQEPSNIAVNTVAYQVEENYSQIDLIELQKKRENIALTAEPCSSNINTDGNYSEIDLDNNVLSTGSNYNDKNSNEYEISEPHNIVFDVESSSVKHVLAPGNGGCEYAVVEKQSGDSKKNDVYAIVNKRRN